ncbi:hypothetical protein GCM10008955_35260 [Deinococcus malanensis]|uniref:Uncharacterized protein n=1 Tax=Deinococcus malanensis TaxID=1706855 RepID=A0ABQ2F1P8_9DEIO|nr:hypothetical protein GCM10008955_35260 [Deinococcus malanensis]
MAQLRKDLFQQAQTRMARILMVQTRKAPLRQTQHCHPPGLPGPPLLGCRRPRRTPLPGPSLEGLKSRNRCLGSGALSLQVWRRRARLGLAKRRLELV